MKILFIYPDVVTTVINFCPAVHVLSAVLKEIGCEVDLLHVNNEYGVKYDKETIVSASQGYGLYAITSTSFNYKYANEIAGWIRDNGRLVILGGCHATIQPEDFKDSNFDIFCVGEGEEPMKDLVYALKEGKDWTKVPNLITRYGANPVRGFLKDLNKLPNLDFDVTDTKKILEIRNGWFSISFSRGCPFTCTFCINHLYKKLEIGEDDKMSGYMRKRSPEKAVDEMLSLTKKYPGQIKVFNFDDDLLTMDKKWMKEFAKRYTELIYLPYNIKYAINSRASFIDDNMAKLLASSGCHEVRIGFETGNEKLRNEILNKFISNDDLITACASLDKYDVKTNLFAMMGVPGETFETFWDTVNMIVKLKPKLIRMTFLYPYTHTLIYDMCVERNLFKKKFVSDDSFTESPLVFPDLSDKDVFCFRILFPWFVNIALHNDCRYKKAINHYYEMSFEELKEMVSEIIKKDSELSRGCKIPHYKYFDNNTNYFQYYDYIEDPI